ncbi:MAG: threonylcarbamoyl-AMP synthase [Bacteroidales bacterium]|nr:threonylcarbamoyl-AMP synthase [Bacteroidales bacterium]
MDYREEIDKALAVLRNGGVILYPTDTVWGIGCDATDPAAVAKVYGIKRRADSKSLVLLASDLDMVGRYVREIPEMAIQLVEVNDRPMTIVYPGAVAGERPAEGQEAVADRNCLAYSTVAEDGSVGIRIPMMDFCRDLVHRFGRPVVSTSANISGEATPKAFAEIPDAVKDAVDYIVEPSLEAGATGQSSSVIKVGLDSSIVIIRK